jgi:hypothetical protein
MNDDGSDNKKRVLAFWGFLNGNGGKFVRV